MSSKIFAVLALLVLVMSPAVLAAAVGPGYGYGYPPGGGGGEDSPLDITLDSSCEENVITVYRKNTPELISGAHVTVTDVTGAPIFSGDTGVYPEEPGELTFGSYPDYCGLTVIVTATKSGYQPEEETFVLVPCEQCGPYCGDGTCDEGETYENCPEDCAPPLVPPEEEEEDGAAPGDGEGDGGPPEGEGMRCTTNDDCEDGEYCDIPSTETVYGTCEPVVGECGYAENHVWVAYECGPEAGCPTCESGFECDNHVCVTASAPPPAEEGGAAPGEGEEGDEGEETGEEGLPPWLFILGGLVLLGLLIWWFLTQQQGSRGRR